MTWLASCAATPAAQSASDAEGACAAFTLLSADAAGARSKLVVEVVINGQTRRMQLDTGSKRSWLYEHDLATTGVPETFAGASFESTDVSVAIGAHHVPKQRLLLHPPVVEAHGLSGTLGMDFMRRAAVRIDYAQSRICFLGSHGQHLWKDVVPIPARIVDGRLVLPWHARGGEVLHLLFDTGAGAVPLVVDQAVWKWLTGRAGDESDNQRIALQMFHGPAHLLGAPLATPLWVGKFKVDGPLTAFFFENPAQRPPEWPPEVHGASGNSAFGGRVVVFDAREAQPKFGVLDTGDD